MDRDARKGIEMTKHTTEKEKSLGELKIAIIEAIQNLAENIPEQKDYSGQIKQILDSLTGKKELNLKSLEEGLNKILKAVDTPDFLNDIVEYNRVKVSLSDEQIKKLGKSMSVSVGGGGGGSGYVKNTLGNNINPATEETIQSIAGLNIPKHDTKELVYTDGVLTSIVYKLAGATVATETLIYTDGIFTGVTIL
jgi:hypothetical protein